MNESPFIERLESNTLSTLINNHPGCAPSFKFVRRNDEVVVGLVNENTRIFHRDLLLVLVPEISQEYIDIITDRRLKLPNSIFDGVLDDAGSIIVIHNKPYLAGESFDFGRGDDNQRHVSAEIIAGKVIIR